MRVQLLSLQHWLPKGVMGNNCGQAKAIKEAEDSEFINNGKLLEILKDILVIFICSSYNCF